MSQTGIDMHVGITKEKIRNLWSDSKHKIDAEKLVGALVDIIKCRTWTDEQKIQHCKEAIDAATRRGYFIGQYPKE